MTYNNDPYGNTAKTVMLLENIPIKTFDDLGRIYISKDYYENTILPLVK